MLVGSEGPAVQRAIEQATPPRSLSRSAAPRRGWWPRSVRLPAPVTGMLVTYDPRQRTQVGAGENGGRQLVEYRVVRDVTTIGSH